MPPVRGRELKLFQIHRHLGFDIDAPCAGARIETPFLVLPFTAQGGCPLCGGENSVYRRFCKWIGDGSLDNIFRVLSLEAELEELSLDATIVKAHQHSVWAKKGDLQTKSDTAARELPNPCGRRRLCLSGFVCLASILR